MGRPPHTRARSGDHISELVREAVRERYFGKREERIKAMQALVGIRRHAPASPDGAEIVRRLRRGNRLNKLAGYK